MTETIGQRLKKAREYRHLTLEKAAQVTRIRTQLLQALEDDDFSMMPSPVQARGFLRNYANYLDLNLEQMIDDLRAKKPQTEAESEVIYEDEIIEDPLNTEESDTGVEPESTSEPFWQMWIKRVKREAKEDSPSDGDLDEEPGSQPDPLPVSSPPQVPGSEKGATASEVESAIETEANPNGKDEASVNEVEPKIRFNFGLLLRKWTNFRIPRKQNKIEKTESIVETDADPKEAEQPSLEEVEPKTRFNLGLLIKKWINIRISMPQEKIEQTEKIEEYPEAEVNPEAELEAAVYSKSSSRVIMQEIGSQLQQRRDMLSLTLEEIERHTRVRVQYLKGLESGNFEEMHSTVQMRGMLNSYAKFLDLDVDAIMLRFADGLQAGRIERHPENLRRNKSQIHIPEKMPTLRSFIASDLVFGLGLVVLLFVFSAWGISRVIALQAEQEEQVQAQPTGLSISEVLIGTPVETIISEVTLIPAQDTPIPDQSEGTLEIPTLEIIVNVQVNIVAVERTFLRVIVDGQVAFDGRTIPGNAYLYEAEESVEILAGNGAALRVIYNQRDLGLLGGFGQIASFVYTIDDIVVPTAIIPATPTNTAFVSPTPSLTATPTATGLP